MLSILARTDIGSDADATPTAKGAEVWELGPNMPLGLGTKSQQQTLLLGIERLREQGQALTQGAVPTAHGWGPARAAATPKAREADMGAQSASAREESSWHTLYRERDQSTGKPPSQSVS
jgi:hypothetical protein